MKKQKEMIPINLATLYLFEHYGINLQMDELKDIVLYCEEDPKYMNGCLHYNKKDLDYYGKLFKKYSN